MQCAARQVARKIEDCDWFDLIMSAHDCVDTFASTGDCVELLTSTGVKVIRPVN